MQVEIVIARYNEPVEWVKGYARGINTILYNKGEDIAWHSESSKIMLPNVGRESHTYLSHIVSNYGRLADVTIFLQGQINDIGENVHNNPNNYIKECIQYGFSASAYRVFTPINWKEINFDGDPKYRDAWRSGKLHRSPLTLIDYANRFLGPLPLLTVVSYCGCFAASRVAIHRRPIAYYKELLDRLVSSSNPVEGHYLERLWCYMFSSNSLLPKTIGMGPELQGRFK